MKSILLSLFLLSMTTVFGQDDKALAYDKAQAAIRLMDDGNIEESIVLLKESETLDPKNYVYPYEIAYAHMLKKEYATAIEILNKLKKYKNINSQIYQMSGNCYSYSGKPDKAIKEYEKGMKKFPNDGNLHLEKGNIFLMQEKYDEAIANYEEGVRVDPMYPSNYYRLGKLYLNSTDRLTGLIYGEIFVNLERNTNRTTEISQMLFNAYKKAIILEDSTTEIKFCDIVIDAKDLNMKELRLPLCAVFGKNFILGIVGQTEVTYDTLSQMRSAFLENYFRDDYKNYPNVLFAYQKELKDLNLFDVYNHYLLMLADEAAFNEWRQEHEAEFNTFIDWYTTEHNALEITKKNMFIKD